MSMDEVVPGLWIGDLPSALDVENLRAHGIYSILSVMRGRLTIKETFIQHQVLLDDTEHEDILRHLLPSIHFIQAELDKGRGVLVHCQAGVSRSATVVAAYLMYSKNLDTEAALEMIRNVRPHIEPNENFLRQLEIFHQAQFKITRGNKATRMYYMERTLAEVMNGDGTLPETDMFAKYPHTPSDSTPNTPGYPRRRIRCKMCRHELATREHMLDHGQLGPATPAAATPAASRRPSTSARRSSLGQATRPSIGTSAASTEGRPRRLSRSIGDALTMSSLSLEESNGSADVLAADSLVRRRSSSSRSIKPQLQDLPENPHGEDTSQTSTSALDSDDDDGPDAILSQGTIESPSGMSNAAAKLIGRRMSDAVLSPVGERKEPQWPADVRHAVDEGQGAASSEEKSLPTTFINPSDLAAELYSDPKLAGLRSPHAATSPVQLTTRTPPASAPIIVNPKCSGYFVEPMKWMEPFLASGQIAGKIICPNTKCGAKLGNYDWAGVCCGCKEWVTPGFCINRSKVDEIVK
ncbi:putative dual specificity phosphatase, catalytic domain [Lyophyllum shimeji]|uniref:protein-tyrosine-phosphatase n=1 Tax=Lyophyllum shimeji TaxID=47721 RepID=A0A9P3PUL5_LYOSH|nr:putative dual specificity phosphatase, catalytic domain [Lyophyllum shimeji]